MATKFVPHYKFIDNAKAYDGEHTNHEEGVQMICREVVADLVSRRGDMKNPEGPVGQKFVGYLMKALGYVAAASMESVDHLELSFRHLFPNHAQRTRIVKMLVDENVIQLKELGFKTPNGDGKVSSWTIERGFWNFLTDEAVMKFQEHYCKTIVTKADTKVSLKVKDGKKTLVERRTIDGENDSLIKQAAKKYPFMIAFQTIYNDEDKTTNGRLYHPIQNLRKENREALLSKLTGTNVVTVDIKSSQIRLLLKVIGRKVGWTEDLYAKLEGVEDIPREIIKLATSVMLNTKGDKTHVALAVCKEKHDEFDYGLAKKFEAALNKLSNGAISLAKGMGLRLMNIEGRMQTEMLRIANENDILWFSMHDGGHCADYAAEFMQQQMELVIDRIINEMTMEERAETIGVSVDDLLLIQAGITPKRKQTNPKQKRFVNPEEQQTDSADDAFIREFLESRKAA